MNGLSTRTLVVAGLAVVAATAAIELWMGRLPLGPDGRFGWWETDIWSAAMSQRFADPYSFSHILHGVLFYAALWLTARGASLTTRALGALLLEGAWEVLENSPIIINRYREVTISLGYEGDSVLNSMGDVVMMAIGFGLAARLRLWQSLAFVALVELVMLGLLRDNLTLNILMLLYPIDAIRDWQMAAAPVALPG
jgi:hypothetical protein